MFHSKLLIINTEMRIAPEVETKAVGKAVNVPRKRFVSPKKNS